MTFPRLTDHFASGRHTDLSQQLEPSVLYVAPRDRPSRFIWDNKPGDDVETYLCSVYTRGWDEFRRFAELVGRDTVVAGGYHPTACPGDAERYASRVVTGYCDDVSAVLDGPAGIFAGSFGFTPMRRDLFDIRRNCQVYPDIYPDDVSGSMVSSVGCPYDCDFCSTPGMSGRKMRTGGMPYVEAEIEDLGRHGATTVFLRDESFATNPMLAEVARAISGKFRMVYSFGTGAAMASRPESIRVLAEAGWHSLNFGLEDIGKEYRKNRELASTVKACREHGIDRVFSFIIDDRGDTQDSARARYHALYAAFCDYLPAQVCANFLMPFPGSRLYEQMGPGRPRDFSRYDSKTPLFSGELADWHRRMCVALQWKYYTSAAYAAERDFFCGDLLHLRMNELVAEYDLGEVPHDQLLELS